VKASPNSSPSVQGMDVVQIVNAAFTSPDRVPAVLRNFNNTVSTRWSRRRVRYQEEGVPQPYDIADARRKPKGRDPTVVDYGRVQT
jgi:hypothetical protein